MSGVPEITKGMVKVEFLRLESEGALKEIIVHGDLYRVSPWVPGDLVDGSQMLGNKSLGHIWSVA